METVNGKECGPLGSKQPELVGYPNRSVTLMDLNISRALPIRERRLVGPWCFLDRFGPLSFTAGKPMNVPPHPHIGLQTVSWLLEGEVLHSDSLGSEATVRPGGVNVMTAGSGITHAEETPPENSGQLNGVQLWTALPDSARNIEASFLHIEEVPVIETHGGIIQVFAGQVNGTASPARYYSEILGIDVQIYPGVTLELDLNPAFEHALLVLNGDCKLEQNDLGEQVLYYLGTGRSALSMDSREGSRVLLIGGTPFPETILMWWNFVAREPEEIARARADWEGHTRFGEVPGEHGRRLAAPDLVKFARPNPMS